MPEWLIERGIGETRAVLIEGAEIIQARVELDGITPAGNVLAARVADVGANGRNAVAITDCGDEYLLPRGAAGVTQGATINIEVTREPIPGGEPWKRPLARMSDKAAESVTRLAERLEGRHVPFPAPADELGDAGWGDVLDQARTGLVRFAGGELRISVTPAMTLIDVDGYLAPDELAVVGAAEAAAAICRLDIGGSIGIDLPTARDRGVRLRAAEAIDGVLAPPFERTTVNGFGFVQIVTRRRRASLVELALDRPSFEGRALLRRVALEDAGAKRLVAHPAVVAVLERRPEWIHALGRQIGGAVELRANAALPMSAGYAETL